MQICALRANFELKEALIVRSIGTLVWKAAELWKVAVDRQKPKRMPKHRVYCLIGSQKAWVFDEKQGFLASLRGTGTYCTMRWEGADVARGEENLSNDQQFISRDKNGYSPFFRHLIALPRPLHQPETGRDSNSIRPQGRSFCSRDLRLLGWDDSEPPSLNSVAKHVNRNASAYQWFRTLTHLSVLWFILTKVFSSPSVIPIAQREVLTKCCHCWDWLPVKWEAL